MSPWFLAFVYVVATAVTAIVAWHVNASPHQAFLPEATLRFVTLNDLTLINGSLAHTDLTGVSAKGLNLTGGTLEHADLTGTDLTKATLVAVDLRDARLVATVLANANLTDACLNGAVFQGAILEGATLDGADLRNADLRAATGTWKSANGALYNDATRWQRGSHITPTGPIRGDGRPHPACHEPRSSG
jgi:uncharacterized protein YjbI with pentapeptide repeats